MTGFSSNIQLKDGGTVLLENGYAEYWEPNKMGESTTGIVQIDSLPEAVINELLEIGVIKRK